MIDLLFDGADEEKAVQHYLTSEGRTGRVLDAIEIAFREVQAVAQTDHVDLGEKLISATSELNKRFRQHDLGYEFLGAPSPGFIVRVDEQYVRAQAVAPAIGLLYAEGFHGPLDEFVQAHQDLD